MPFYIVLSFSSAVFRIPDPTFFHPGSASKNLSILTKKKWFLSSRKYDPGYSSRILDPVADFLPILDPRSRGQKGTGSRIRIRNTARQRHRLIGVIIYHIFDSSLKFSGKMCSLAFIWLKWIRQNDAPPVFRIHNTSFRATKSVFVLSIIT